MLTFRLLHVDLSKGESRLAIIPGSLMRQYLGGSSLAAFLLYPWLTPELDPLAPQAPMLLMTGPLTGTFGPATSRWVICAKSPATNLWGESNVGGFVGAALRAAGFDGLLLTGAAPRPVYLWIHNGQVELRPAEHLWGRTDTFETQEVIQGELGVPGVRVACIGLAGERQLPLAAVLSDHGRVAGRTGMGAVMGSKRLKAIAVKGTMPIPIVQRERFESLRREMNRDLRDDNYSRTARAGGTGSILDYTNYLGSMPKHYFTRNVLEGVEQTSGNAMADTILAGVSACHGCVIACGRVVHKNGRQGKGPEYETLVGFGGNLGVLNLRHIVESNDWCDRYGLDSISLAGSIGLAFLMYAHGVIGPRQTGGLALEWGNQQAIVELIHQAARGEGLGQLIGRGTRALARHFERPEMAVEVNGLEVAFHDPRAATGMALVYATSPRGACHNQGDYYMVDLFMMTDDALGIQPLDRLAGAEKAANVARHQDWRTVSNALGICLFANVDALKLGELVNRATGFAYGLKDLMHLGERGWNLKRLINGRLGLRAENDRLPPALLTPYEDGPVAGYVPPFAEMLAAYYQARDWDPVSGMPSAAKVRALGLSDLPRQPLDGLTFEAL